MSWLHTYHNRIVSAEEAVQAVKSGDRVYLTGNCSVPQVLMKALIERAPLLTDVEVCHILTLGKTPYADPEFAGHIRVNTLFIGEGVRAAVNEGRADFTPIRLSEVPGLFTEGILPLDVAFIHVTPPDEHGFCSFGVEVSTNRSAAQSAKLVIAELNPQMPRTLGDAFIHISRIHKIVPVDYPIFTATMGTPSDLSMQIGRHVAGLIEDGSTMQMGIGAIPDGVLYYLKDKKDLGIHTEMFSDGVIELYEKGVVTGEKKTIDKGKMVAGFLIGSKKLYDFVDNNPVVEMRPTEYVNDPYIIRQNDKMVAINSAIEVDLTGQVCADSIGPRLYSGVGGQLDFIRGAARSRGGKPIIGLPSSGDGKDGTRFTRIVSMLKPGAGVVTPRYDVHYVVTEYGVANLYGRTIRQRAKALIDVAHPDFRAELERKAIELRYL
ncbi:MAG: acetyl-CoA hydrolase/transferase family protein [Holophagales bacterium]|nr:acetyl-CoA hydrolase/transferase family protein [Holophagales bacterium]